MDWHETAELILGIVALLALVGAIYLMVTIINAIF